MISSDDVAVFLFSLGWVALVNLVGMVLVLAIKPKGRNRFGGKPGVPRKPVEAIQTCFNMYAAANGRASRSEFWWFFLLCVIIDIVLNVLDDALHTSLFHYGSYGIFLPLLTAQIRRLHDINRSGWWVLLNISLIPVTLWVLCARRPMGDDAEIAASAF
jgi:uncharacterized membrane protein YhaH (DUF805 family)